MSEQPAHWFDGRDSVRYPATVSWVGGRLRVRLAHLGERDYAIGALQWGPLWQRGPVSVALPDGSTLWLHRSGQRESANTPGPAQAMPRPSSWVDAWLASWRAALLTALAVVCLVVWMDRQGMGLAASALVQHLPTKLDDELGQRVFQYIDKKHLLPSQIATGRQLILNARLRLAAEAAAPGLKINLVWRRLKENQAALNAFALPDGTVVVLDGLAKLLTDDELMAVLGHELGHVKHRHGLRSVAMAVGLGAVSQLVLGDFSSYVAGVAGALQGLHYSRDFEREADAFVPAFLSAAGINAAVEASMWRKFAEALHLRGAEEPPTWLSTHPSMAERIKTASERR